MQIRDGTITGEKIAEQNQSTNKPYVKRREGNRVQVVRSDGEKVMGSHRTEALANRQLRELNKSVREESVMDTLLGEVEQFTKPGTANVSPADKSKLSGLLKHYAGMAHPHATCVRDQVKHGLSKDHANRRCAVLKDIIRGTTKWRNNEGLIAAAGKGDEEAAALLETALDAHRFVTEASEEFGGAAIAEMALQEADGEEGSLEEAAQQAIGVLNLYGAELVETVREAKPELLEAAYGVFPSTSSMRSFRGVRRTALRQRRQSAFKKQQSKKAPQSKPGSKKGGGGGEHEGVGKYVRSGNTGRLANAVADKLGLSNNASESKFKSAVRQYQRQNSLQVDGRVGAQTLSSIAGLGTTKPGQLTTDLRRNARRKLGITTRRRSGARR